MREILPIVTAGAGELLLVLSDGSMLARYLQLRSGSGISPAMAAKKPKRRHRGRGQG